MLKKILGGLPLRSIMLAVTMAGLLITSTASADVKDVGYSLHGAYLTDADGSIVDSHVEWRITSKPIGAPPTFAPPPPPPPPQDENKNNSRDLATLIRELIERMLRDLGLAGASAMATTDEIVAIMDPLDTLDDLYTIMDALHAGMGDLDTPDAVLYAVMLDVVMDAMDSLDDTADADAIRDALKNALEGIGNSAKVAPDTRDAEDREHLKETPDAEDDKGNTQKEAPKDPNGKGSNTQPAPDTLDAEDWEDLKEALDDKVTENEADQ